MVRKTGAVLVFALAALVAIASAAEPVKRLSADMKKSVRKAVGGDRKAQARIEKIGPLSRAAAADVQKKVLDGWRFRGLKGTERIELTVAGKKCEYVLSAPKRYSSRRSWPLILSLHGAGGNGPMELSFQWSSVRSMWKGFIAAPSGNPPGDQWFFEQEAFVLEVLRDAMSRANIDANRVYVNGFSNGGNGAWFYGLYHPGRFAAMCTRGGGTPNMQMLVNLLHVPTYIVHGENDTVIKVDHDRQCAAALEKLGYEHVYTEVPGGGHKPFNEENPKILHFFEEHRREPWPRALKFLPRTDGQGMRNLWLEIPAGSARGVVEATVEGNVVTVKGASRVVLWLGDDLLDLDAEITVRLGGTEAFRGEVERTLTTVVSDLRARADRQAPAWARLEVGR